MAKRETDVGDTDADIGTHRGADANVSTSASGVSAPDHLVALTCDGCGQRPVPVAASGRFGLWCPCLTETDGSPVVVVQPESRLPTQWRALDRLPVDPASGGGGSDD